MRHPFLAAAALALAAAPLACAHEGDCPAQPPLPPPPASVAPPPSAAPAATGPLPCAAPDGSEPPIVLDGVPLAVLCHDVYADPVTTTEERDALRRLYATALARLTATFGTARAAPGALFCKSDACARRFSGPTRRSHAVMEPRPMVIVNGFGPLTEGTIVHEMTHIELNRRTGSHHLPTWFDEGVATFVGDNMPCPPGTKRAIDDLRRLTAPYAYTAYTNVAGKGPPTYCQVRAEVAAWVERHDRQALLGVIDAVAAGRPFDEVYGPLVTAIPPEAYDRSLDGRFTLDENKGTDLADETGRAHTAALMQGATWTTGHRGAGVKVNDGAFVRADGFVDLGVPDAPFTVSLWMKPLGDARVLVHTAAQASGGDGFCVPLLGHDTGGHLVAQVNVAPDAKAFLTATGPTLPRRAWSHVAVTWSASDGVRLYVDGAPAAAAKPASEADRHRFAPGSPMYLFFGSDVGAHCWTSTLEHGDTSGVLDEIHVFDYALTPAEIAADMGKR